MSNTSHNTEVEVRALLSVGQETEIIEKLLRDNATEESPEKITDVYFCPKDFTEFSQIAMNEVGSYSLRIRESEKDNKKIITMNSKTITHYGDHSAWEEHEIEVGAFQEACTLLTTIGYKPFFKVEKIRHPYALKDQHMTINIEEIKDFGTTLEAEIITDTEHRDSAKQTIRTYLHQLGITDDQIPPKSISSMLMYEKSDFSGEIQF